MPTKENRLAWLTRVFSDDRAAVAPDIVANHIVDPAHVFGIEQTTRRFPPLKKIFAERDGVEFHLGEVRHTDPDRSFVEFCLDGEVALIVVARFEEAAPFRMKYWGAYPPLPAGVEIRPYRASDAAGCRDLELRCPMEFADGESWVIDRGARFDDYLRLAADFEASVAVDATGRVIGFLSNELRPIVLDTPPMATLGRRPEKERDEAADTFCVYQHHYRVDPEYRGASVSMALSTHVDSRRAYEHLDVRFPYSLIDARNVRMQNTGFPAVEGVTVARLAIPTTIGTTAPLRSPDVETICSRINATHERRRLFKPYDAVSLNERCGRIDGYRLDHFVSAADAVLGIWAVGERNLGGRDGVLDERRVAFALDYGFESVAGLVELVRAAVGVLREGGTTHLGFVLDVRAPEYEALKAMADDEQRFRVHTLPWLAEMFAERVVHWDAVYC